MKLIVVGQTNGSGQGRISPGCLSRAFVSRHGRLLFSQPDYVSLDRGENRVAEKTRLKGL